MNEFWELKFTLAMAMHKMACASKYLRQHKRKGFILNRIWIRVGVEMFCSIPTSPRLASRLMRRPPKQPLQLAALAEATPGVPQLTSGGHTHAPALLTSEAPRDLTVLRPRSRVTPPTAATAPQIWTRASVTRSDCFLESRRGPGPCPGWTPWGCCWSPPIIAVSRWPINTSWLSTG